MTSFSSLPFPFLLALGALFLIVLFFSVTLFSLKKKLTLFMGGKTAREFEETVKETLEEVKKLKRDLEEAKDHIKDLEKNELHLVKTPELLRYKALEGASSNQSFSLALLNSQGDGTVLTTLHVRDRISFYAKNINGWEAETDPTEEEKEVINRVRSSD